MKTFRFAIVLFFALLCAAGFGASLSGGHQFGAFYFGLIWVVLSTEAWKLRPWAQVRCTCPVQFRIGRSCGDKVILSSDQHPHFPDTFLVTYTETLKFQCTHCKRVSLTKSMGSTIEKRFQS